MRLGGGSANARGAIMGLDPREAVGWSVNRGRRWVWGRRVGGGPARFSYMGAPDGPLGQVVRYDVATHTLTIERAGRTEHSREHVFDYFLRNKRNEWNDYRRQVTEFELGRYLPIL